MTFKIERTSGDWTHPAKPCKKAYQKRVFWYTKQERIRDEKGKFATQETTIYHDEWFIDIETLQDLLDFIKEIDEEVIIYCTSTSKGEYVIEIYDDYRE